MSRFLGESKRGGIQSSSLSDGTLTMSNGLLEGVVSVNGIPPVQITINTADIATNTGTLAQIQVTLAQIPVTLAQIPVTLAQILVTLVPIPPL